MESYNFQDNHNKSLFLTQSGFQKSHKGHSVPRALYNDYSAHFILSGKGIFKAGGETYTLEKGSGFMIIPGIENEYCADKEDADRILLNAGITSKRPIFEFPTDEATLNDLNAVFLAGKNRLTMGYDAIGYFFLVIGRMVMAYKKKHIVDNSESYYIDMALEYIEEHYADEITIQNIARYVGFERTYFYRMFVNRMNISPSEYINDLRLKKAVSFMISDRYSLNEIAFLTGFYDYSHFFKAFKKKYKVTPKRFREEQKKNGV